LQYRKVSGVSVINQIIMTKSSTSFYLSETTKAQLKMLSDLDKRSQANYLEILVQQDFDSKKLVLPVIAEKKPKPAAKKPTK